MREVNERVEHSTLHRFGTHAFFDIMSIMSCIFLETVARCI